MGLNICLLNEIGFDAHDNMELTMLFNLDSIKVHYKVWMLKRSNYFFI